MNTDERASCWKLEPIPAEPRARFGRLFEGDEEVLAARSAGGDHEAMSDSSQREVAEKAVAALALLMDSVVVDHPGLQKIDFSKPVDENVKITEVDERHVKAMLSGENARNKLLKFID